MGKQERESEKVLAIAELLVVEGNKRESALHQKRQSLTTKGVVLAGAATLTTSINIADSSLTCIWIMGILFTLAGAGAGAASLFPKQGEVNDIATLEKELWGNEPSDATRIYAHRIKLIVDKDEAVIRQQALFIRYGLLFLVIGTFLLVLQSVIGKL